MLHHPASRTLPLLTPSLGELRDRRIIHQVPDPGVGGDGTHSVISIREAGNEAVPRVGVRVRDGLSGAEELDADPAVRTGIAGDVAGWGIERGQMDERRDRKASWVGDMDGVVLTPVGTCVRYLCTSPDLVTGFNVCDIGMIWY